MIELAAAVFWITACTLIGVRLVLLASRTRGLPEILIGIAFLLAGLVSPGLNLLRGLAALEPSLDVILGSLALAALHCGIAMIAGFTWRVFRPGRVGAVACALFILALAAGSVAEIVAFDPRPNAPMTTGFWFSVSIRIGIYGWATVEALAYWAQLRRRMNLGLADPVVTNRILMWAMGTGSITLLWVRAAYLGMASTEGVAALGGLVQTALILWCVAAFWLSFFPPAAYQDALRRRAAAG